MKRKIIFLAMLLAALAFVFAASPCGICSGTGRCVACQGSGYDEVRNRICSSCNGSGYCPECGGSGML